MSAPKVLNLKHVPGIAGQFAIRATVEYPGEPVSVVTFTGHTLGGPVVVESATMPQTFVTNPGRFGDFGVSWVRRFFGENL